MKRNVDYPEYQEHKNFRINNKQRYYFGIDKIDEKWDEIQLNERITVFYDYDIIRKVIKWDNHAFFSYKEYDTELKTRDREFILPKTSKGIEKKTTPSNILSFKPTGCIAFFTLKTNGYNAGISVYNPRNNIRLSLTVDNDIKTINELNTWIDEYINTVPVNHFEKVKRMKNTVPRIIKYNVGDVFRFELDRDNYGFGLIVGKIDELKRAGIFVKDHPMSSTMIVPILIRLYIIKTPYKDVTINQLEEYELMPSDLMSDYEILHGTHDIIGNKPLKEKDIDFPIQCCYRRNENNKPVLQFAWGVGMISKVEILNTPDTIVNRIFENTGVALGLHTYRLERVLMGESLYHPLCDFLHTDNIKTKIEVFELLELPIDIDFDGFNKDHNGMTRIQYIDFIANKHS